ncbi:cytochrome o ubiquinol oxidase subunit IV [Sphingomonas bacterium]|uniref:cytochrome o ubiquinol oxidase subunit IV n=1 Tax=Sphingomonas bacterium TaxID=1895847 RepID=UPI0015762BCE|nr:cytochrome o ubiquinol oxidase subunit IV [Sphingomonas bacterium]
MSERDLTPEARSDSAPGEQGDPDHDPAAGIRGYVVGLVLAALLTGASFLVAAGGLVWAPGIPVALIALAIGQMGVHLVFFLHITSGPDNTNNTLALAFGVLIVGLVLVGTLWIMANLSHNMVSMEAMMHAQP